MQTVLPLSFKLSKRYAEIVWANCLPKLFSVGFIGVGSFLGWVFLPWLKVDTLWGHSGFEQRMRPASQATARRRRGRLLARSTLPCIARYHKLCQQCFQRTVSQQWFEVESGRPKWFFWRGKTWAIAFRRFFLNSAILLNLGCFPWKI